MDSNGSGPGITELKKIHNRTMAAMKFAREQKTEKVKLQVVPLPVPVVKKEVQKKTVKRSKKKEVKKPLIIDQRPLQIDKPVVKPAPQGSALESLGFVPGDKAPAEPKDTFSLPNQMGALLGTLQRYKLVIVIAGETASGKSQLGMQVANGFAEMGDEVAWLDYEQGGLHSRDRQNTLNRNTSPAGKSRIKVKGDYPRSLEAIKELAKTAKVIGIDSGSVLRLRQNTWIEELREQFPNTVFIIMMQLTGDGTTRGGTGAEFDAPTVLKTYKDDYDPLKNYAIVEKNRGNRTGIKYLINQKRFIK